MSCKPKTNRILELHFLVETA